MTNSEKPVELNNSGGSNWTNSVMGRVVAGSIITAEATPVNEFVRLAALAYAIKTSNHDPIIGALAYGAATFAIEAPAAVAAADVLGSNNGKQLTAKLNQYLEDRKIDKYLKTNLPTEAALAAFGGSAIVVAAKHRQDPERSISENRRYGMASAIGLTAMCAVQGYGITVGAEHYTSPVTWATAALGVGAAVGAWKWAKNKVAGTPEVEHVEINSGESPQYLGLSDEDRERALANPEVLKIPVANEDGELVDEPLLVPIKELYWYNLPYLTQQYGADSNIYYYAHPQIDLAENEQAQATVDSVLNGGGTIVYDTVTCKTVEHGDIAKQLDETTIDFQREKLGGGTQDRFLNQYAGEILFKGKKEPEYKTSLRLYDQYSQAVSSGIFEKNELNGASLIEVADGETAEKLWKIYDAPFMKLGENHPISAGFDKDGFMEVLKDPDVVKVINREDGEITTLALFVNDFKHCPWLDPKYYQVTYPEAYETNNIMIFTGIVTDTDHRGNSYSLSLINLLMKTAALRDTPALITFECGDISAKYVPKAVRYGIWKSGVGKIQGINKPKSQLNYYAITRSIERDE